MINVYYQNVRGLNTKLSEFYINMNLATYDIVILTETWLTPLITDNMLFPSDYTIFRKDRLVKKGGGILIALKNHIKAIEIIPTKTKIECLWLLINDGKGTNLYIGNNYLPPTKKT